MRAVTGATVERLRGLPVGFDALLADSLADGWRMLQVLLEDWEAGTVRFDGPGEALFGALDGVRLVAIGGCTRDPYSSMPDVGRVRRFYVRRDARRRGAGRALLDAITAQAAQEFVALRVRAPTSAWPFYERCGFLRAVGEPSATHLRPLATG